MAAAADAGAVKAAAAKIAEAAGKVLEGPEAEDAALYAKLAVKLEAKGKEFIGTETARLERMLSSGSVSEDKATVMLKKINILESFSAAAEEEEGGDDAAEL